MPVLSGNNLLWKFVFSSILTDTLYRDIRWSPCIFSKYCAITEAPKTLVRQSVCFVLFFFLIYSIVLFLTIRKLCRVEKCVLGIWIEKKLFSCNGCSLRIFFSCCFEVTSIITVIFSSVEQRNWDGVGTVLSCSLL